jgi:hypothetical protein
MNLEDGQLQQGVFAIEHPARERNFPHGIVIPLSSLLSIDAGGADVMKVAQVIDYVGPLVDILIRYHATIGESSLTDVIEACQYENSTRSLFKRIFSGNYEGPIYEIDQKAIKGEGPEKIKAEFHKRILDALLEGPDIDCRLDCTPEDIYQIFHRLIRMYQLEYGRQTYKCIEKIAPNEHTVEFELKDVITIYPRRKPYYVARLSDCNHVLVIRITSGTYEDSHIPFCNVQFVGRSKLLETDSMLFSIGMSPYIKRMPPEMQERDTRGSSKVNLYDRKNAYVAASVSELPQVFWETALPLDPIKANRYPSLRQITMTEAGFVYPGVSGDWRNGSYIINNCILDPFIFIPPDCIENLCQPIEFGENFGQGSVIETFLECLRVMRKASRYHGLSQSEQTLKALNILRGDTLPSSGENLGEAIRAEAGRNPYGTWQIRAVREIITGLFHAPQEFIGIAEKTNLSKYLPRWHYIEAMKAELAKKSDMDRLAHMVILGYHTPLGRPTNTLGIIRREMRKLARTGQEIKRQIENMNTLELIFWLIMVE